MRFLFALYKPPYPHKSDKLILTPSTRCCFANYDAKLNAGKSIVDEMIRHHVPRIAKYILHLRKSVRNLVSVPDCTGPRLETEPSFRSGRGTRCTSAAREVLG